MTNLGLTSTAQKAKVSLWLGSEVSSRALVLLSGSPVWISRHHTLSVSRHLMCTVAIIPCHETQALCI